MRGKYVNSSLAKGPDVGLRYLFVNLQGFGDLEGLCAAYTKNIYLRTYMLKHLTLRLCEHYLLKKLIRR